MTYPSNGYPNLKDGPSKKHPAREGKFKESPPLHAEEEIEETPIGLVQDEDGSFKVQGRAHLTDFTTDFRIIKACHFASAYAILQAITLPIHHWRAAIIDNIIEKAQTLYSRIACKDIRRKRFIKNLELDDYIFDICIVLAKQYTKNQPHISQSFYHILKTRKYFLLQIDLATFAVYYDKFFYLFNSYSIQESLDKENREKKAKKRKSEEFCDYDGCGWIVFPNIQKFHQFITTMTGDTCWENHYNIYYVEIMKFKETSSIAKANNFMKKPFKTVSMTDTEPQDCHQWKKIKGEKLSWISPCMPIWSRKNKRLDAFRNEKGNKYKAFDIEISEELYSLFGTLHPKAATFTCARGKQYLATHVLSCCVAHLFRVTEWNSYLLDTIVIHGDRYHHESFKSIKNPNFEVTIEHLNSSYRMENFKINTDIRKSTYGIFFCHPNSDDFNLGKALVYFFERDNRYGVLTYEGRSIAFGLANKGYFLYDCQSYGHPLFHTDQGASYCLLCSSLHRLIYCIILALNVRKHIEFVIYSVHVRIKKSSKFCKGEKGDCEKSKLKAQKIADEKHKREKSQEQNEENKE